MKVGVIIPVHNREAYIASALRSLLRQQHDADLDIVVVDDGSTDGTREIVTAMADRSPCVRLVRQSKAGIAKARNTGLSHLRDDCDLLTFLDSDDISAAGRFAAEVPLFAADPSLAMTYSMMTLADDIDDTELLPTATSNTCTLRGISLTTAMFRRRAILHLGGFNEALNQSEDWDFLVRFFEHQGKYKLLDNVAIFYRRHPGNITRDVAQGQRDFLKVVLMSAKRRSRDPILANIPRFFDLTPLFDDRYAALR
ncbi:glycosyltransferase family 2 protein [Mesorhizobium sp. ES1-1]|uniref:glycosyltransferase family 2 protein n=1 Tax=Mesorhizobium sp. ES1-1 TaxID=2876629 RepID=UPI001CCA1E16|nr:glycosyltransferase family 2 protein [Mesorhizobium sp. ES1-1]MBZ9678790.1 glycosyltransferase family 2 protein [Mesorhizobium sp. ES1-1]